MNQKVIVVFLVVCLFGGALSQDLWKMLMFNKMFANQGPMDANVAQNTNALGEAGTQGQEQGTGATTGTGPDMNQMMPRRNMMSRMVMPMLLGYDMNDPISMMLMTGGFGM